MLELSAYNYFSREADEAYMSNSQFKSFAACQAAALARINGAWDEEPKECFLEGHLFEALVTGDGEAFFEQHPEILSSRGDSKGKPKVIYQRAGEAAVAVRRNDEIRAIIDRSEKQKIITGEIGGVPFKGCIDLYDPETGDVWDFKYVRDFEPVWDDKTRARVPWYVAYRYPQQLAIYRELLRQNNIRARRFGQIAATKQDEPDVDWLAFDHTILDDELLNVEAWAMTYDLIKRGIIETERCGHCAYCRATKEIVEPRWIGFSRQEEEDA